MLPYMIGMGFLHEWNWGLKLMGFGSYTNRMGFLYEQKGNYWCHFAAAAQKHTGNVFIVSSSFILLQMGGIVFENMEVWDRSHRCLRAIHGTGPIGFSEHHMGPVPYIHQNLIWGWSQKYLRAIYGISPIGVS